MIPVLTIYLLCRACDCRVSYYPPPAWPVTSSEMRPAMHTHRHVEVRHPYMWPQVRFNWWGW